MRGCALGMLSVLLLCGTAWVVTAQEEAVVAADPFVCADTDLICDPVPVSTTDTQVYAKGYKITTKSGYVSKQTGGDAWYGKLVFGLPSKMSQGTLTFEIKGLTSNTSKCAPYFIQLNNGLGGIGYGGKSEAQIRPVNGTKPRLEMAWRGCCEAANYDKAKGSLAADAAGGFTTVTIKWNSNSVAVYQGRGSSIQVRHSLPNKLGSYIPPNWKAGSCGSRPTKGALIVSKIELPERFYNKYDYFIRNVKLTAE